MVAYIAFVVVIRQ